MRFRFKVIFSVALVFLLIISLLVGWSLFHLRLGIGLRNDTGYIQEKLDDVIETIQSADNAFLLFKLSRSQTIYEGFIRSIQQANLEVNELLLLNQNSPEVLAEVLILKDMMMDKVDFSRRIIFHNEFGETPRLKEIMTVRDDLLMTKQIRERINKIDGMVVRRMQEHQTYVDTYYGFIFFTVCFCLVGAGIFFVIFASLVGNEIERRAQLETHLRQAEETAINASNLKSQFLATISHEIRTPLNGILGMSDLINQRAADSETKRFSEIIHTSGKSLLRIVNDILDFSKIEANKVQIEVQETQLSRLLESVIELFAKKAGEKQLRLFGSYPPSLRDSVALDATRILQVCQNLVGNAVKFTDAGQVEVSGGFRSIRDELIFEFQVKDSGSGIPQDKRSLLFQPFVQLPNAKSQEGTGLGLSISERLIKSMNGEIGFESKEGVGSVFYFRIPVRRMAASRQPVVSPHLRESAFLLLSESAPVQRFFRSFCTERDVALCPQTQLPSTRSGQRLYVWGESQAHLDDSLKSELIKKGWDPVAVVIPPCLTPEKVEWLTTPSAAVVGSSKETQSKPPVANPKRGDVLLVEDNATNQILAETHLQMLGFRVQIASSGEECLALLKEQKFDLIFMDCRMPGMDGYETAKCIRGWEASRQLPRTPIVALTANALAGEKEHCLAAGMDDYLTKPLEPQRLREILADRFPLKTDDGVSPAVEDPLANIDWQVLVALEKKTNSKVVRKLQTVYLDNLSKFANEFERMTKLDEVNEADLLQIVHQLKSSSAVVGAGELSLLCASLEQKLEAGGAVALGEIKTLRAACLQVQRALEKRGS